MDRAIWENGYDSRSLRAFPCSRCSAGSLLVKRDSFNVESSGHMQQWRQSEDYDPRDDVAYFTCAARCSEPSCGQIAMIVGTVGSAEEIDSEYGMSIRDDYIVKAINPPPQIIPVLDDLPWKIKRSLISAFSLYWSDLGSCANKIRIVVENTLDDLGIPPAANLAHRIEAFKKVNPEHAETFDALRVVGNEGSHKGSVDVDYVLDCFMLIEDALSDLYGKRKDQLNAIKQKIISSKGKKP